MISGLDTPEGFLVDRSVWPTEDQQEVVRYYFRVDLGLNLYITQESESYPDYLETTITSGLRTLAKQMVKRGNEILDGNP